MKIIWENPPTRLTRRSKIDQALPILKKNPGRWAKLGTYRHASSASAMATTWRRRYAQDNDLEIVSRGFNVYVRYVGSSVSDNGSEVRETASV